MTFKLDMWVVYDHPRDFPDFWVARRWEITTGQERATDEHIVAADLVAIRDEMARRGLSYMPRYESDDPKIFEVWL